MKAQTARGLVTALAFAAVNAMTAWATPQPDPECVGKSSGDVCRPATTCSDAALCTDSLKCPNGPVNPEKYNGDPCETDNNACTADVCAGGQCRHNTINCDDGNACTTDGCDTIAGCQYTDVNCDDGVACTSDTCSPTMGCQHTFVTDDCDGATCGTSPCGNTCGPPCSTACIPEITCPSGATAECIDGAGQNTLAAATATCGADITNDGEASYAFSCDGDNSHVVTYTATDSDGSDMCTATLTVEDTGKPSVACGTSSTWKSEYTQPSDAGSCGFGLPLCVPELLRLTRMKSPLANTTEAMFGTSETCTTCWPFGPVSVITRLLAAVS